MDVYRELAIRYRQDQLALSNHPRPDCLEADLEGRRLLNSGVDSPYSGLNGYPLRESLVQGAQQLGANSDRPNPSSTLGSMVCFQLYLWLI